MRLKHINQVKAGRSVYKQKGRKNIESIWRYFKFLEIYRKTPLIKSKFNSSTDSKIGSFGLKSGLVYSFESFLYFNFLVGLMYDFLNLFGGFFLVKYFVIDGKEQKLWYQWLLNWALGAGCSSRYCVQTGFTESLSGSDSASMVFM